MYNQQKSNIQKLLDQNSQLILLMLDLISKGKQNECLEHQRTLYRNLTYLIQFDPNSSHHANNLPLPDSSTMTNIQSGQTYRSQLTTSTSSNMLTQSSTLNSLNRPNMPQQRPPYSMQQNGNGQYSVGLPQQNHLVQQQWQHQSRMPVQQQIYPQT